MYILYSKCTNWTAKGVPVHDTKDWHKGKHKSVTRVKVSPFLYFYHFDCKFQRIKASADRAGRLPQPAQSKVPGHEKITSHVSIAFLNSKLLIAQNHTTTKVVEAAISMLV